MLMQWLAYWPIGVFFLNAVVGWLLWSARREFVAKVDLLTVTRAIETLDKRIITMEHEIHHRPDSTMVGELTVQIARLEGEVKALTDSLRAQQRLYEHQKHQASLIEDILRALNIPRSSSS